MRLYVGMQIYLQVAKYIHRCAEGGGRETGDLGQSRKGDEQIHTNGHYVILKVHELMHTR